MNLMTTNPTPLPTSAAQPQLRNGWETSAPSSDSVLLAGTRAMAERAEWWATAMGGRSERDGDLVLTDTATDCLLLNQTLCTAPLQPAHARRALEFYPPNRPFVISSPNGGSDLAETGLKLMGHPPFMQHPAGPPPASPPPEVTLTEVTEPTQLVSWSKILADGFPLGPLSLPVAFLGGPTRLWLASWQGQPAAAAASHVAHGMIDVEAVATLPEHRSRGLGTAVTWAATRDQPTLHACLLASDSGRPVYERMGYIPIHRWTMWYRD